MYVASAARATNVEKGTAVNRQDSVFDAKERAAQKQAAREADEAALKSGAKTPEMLRRENASFAFAGVRVSLRGARVPK